MLRALTSAKTRYAHIVIEELLVIVHVCGKFDACVYGRDEIIVNTAYHNPMTFIFKKPLNAAPMKLTTRAATT